MHSAHNQVIAVNPQDQPIGLSDKLKSHQDGTQHRAFSVFLYRFTANKSIELLLQKRHSSKYHSAGLWTNTCCSHPMHLESPLQAAHRRLREELHLDNLILRCIGKIAYHVTTDTLSENEIDYIFIGEFKQNIDANSVNQQEIESLKWATLEQLEQALSDTPEQYTNWLPHVIKHLTANL
jgi:isopentenyl-diphosphate Delta-isomerase